MNGPRRLSVFFAGFLIVTSVACGSGKGSPSARPTPTEAPPPADAAAIRAIDFSQVPAFQTLLRQTAGQLDYQAIVYADVTGDGREEAIIPIASGGTLGNVAYQVYTLRGGVAALILTSTREPGTASGLVLTVEDGKLTRTVGKYGPSDPRCCPSSLVKTSYRWDGTNLQVEREQEVAAAPGPKRGD